MSKLPRFLVFLVAIPLVCACSRQSLPQAKSVAALPGRVEPTLVVAQQADNGSVPSAETFVNLLYTDYGSLEMIESHWHPGSAAMLIEIYRFIRSPQIGNRIIDLLSSKTGQQFAGDISAWQHWLWKQEYQPHPEYAKFKQLLYAGIDHRFAEYFGSDNTPKIRLDQIAWGGVRRDGIPPLKNPEMISAEQATWLEDSNEVFGIIINGDARCYPKRILAWHEMFKDTIGGQSVCGVY